MENGLSNENLSFKMSVRSSIRFNSPVIKTLERHFFTLSECLSNVLITRESNFDEINGQEMFN